MVPSTSVELRQMEGKTLNIVNREIRLFHIPITKIGFPTDSLKIKKLKLFW